MGMFFEDGIKVYIEITRLFSQETVREYDEIIDEIYKRLEDLPNNTYVISFYLNDSFGKEDVEEFVEYIEKMILRRPHGSHLKYEFKRDNVVKARFTLAKSKRKQGYVAVMTHPILTLKSDIRIKNKMLCKLCQLSESDYNVLVVNLSSIIDRRYNFLNAYIGELVVRIYPSEHEKIEYIRRRNGVIHDPRARKLSGVITYIDFMFEKHDIYCNPYSGKPLTKEVISRITQSTPTIDRIHYCYLED